LNNVVNLNKFRKKKARKDKDKSADENRAKYGRTKSEKKKADLENKLAGRNLDGHERQDDED
jgi:hypothetical protein